MDLAYQGLSSKIESIDENVRNDVQSLRDQLEEHAAAMAKIQVKSSLITNSLSTFLINYYQYLGEFGFHHSTAVPANYIHIISSY
jgi:hypothetical protein